MLYLIRYLSAQYFSCFPGKKQISQVQRKQVFMIGNQHGGIGALGSSAGSATCPLPHFGKFHHFFVWVPLLGFHHRLTGVPVQTQANTSKCYKVLFKSLLLLLKCVSHWGRSAVFVHVNEYCTKNAWFLSKCSCPVQYSTTRAILSLQGDQKGGTWNPQCPPALALK